MPTRQNRGFVALTAHFRAPLGFVFNYVPYLGALSGMAIATVVGLITFD